MSIRDVEGTISGTVLKVISNIIQSTEGNYQIIPSVVFKVIADLLIKKIPITYPSLRLITTSIDSYHLFKEPGQSKYIFAPVFYFLMLSGSFILCIKRCSWVQERKDLLRLLNYGPRIFVKGYKLIKHYKATNKKPSKRK